MMEQAYACDGCKAVQATAGRCSSCNLDLSKKSLPLFSAVIPSSENGTIRVTSAPGRTLRYSEMESALMKQSIKVDAAKFPIAGNACLVFSGGTMEDSMRIEKALLDANIFELAKASLDPVSNETRILVQSGKTPPMRASVVSAIATLGTKVTLTDVIWGPLAAPAKI